jgi:hypothetical protein
MGWRKENRKRDPNELSAELKKLPKEKQDVIIKDRRDDKALDAIQQRFNYASKANYWTEVEKPYHTIQASEITDDTKDWLNSLPVVDISGMTKNGPLDIPDSVVEDAKKQSGGTKFVAKRGNKHYFVETGGYDYARNVMTIEDGIIDKFDYKKLVEDSDKASQAHEANRNEGVRALIDHAKLMWRNDKSAGRSFDEFKQFLGKHLNLSDEQWAEVKGHTEVKYTDDENLNLLANDMQNNFNIGTEWSDIQLEEIENKYNSSDKNKRARQRTAQIKDAYDALLTYNKNKS